MTAGQQKPAREFEIDRKNNAMAAYLVQAREHAVELEDISVLQRLRRLPNTVNRVQGDHDIATATSDAVHASSNGGERLIRNVL